THNASATCLSVSVRTEDVERSITRGESKAPAALAQIEEEWRSRLPHDAEALWAFVTVADQETLLSLLAVMVAPGLDLRSGAKAFGSIVHDHICQAITVAAGLDMAKWWRASAESYFEHVRKDVILDAIIELSPKLDRSKLEKTSKKEVLARAKK